MDAIEYNNIEVSSKMRRKNYKIRQFALGGAKVNCSTFSKKIVAEENGDDSGREHHQYFVTGDNQNNVKFYGFSEEEELLSFSSGVNANIQTQVSAVGISLDEKNIFSGSNRGIINIWDVLSAKNIPSCTLRGHATSVNCFGLFPGEENRLASGSYDTHIKLWDIKEKNNVGMLKHHNKQINAIQISPDCRYLLSGSEDCTTKLWDLRAPEKVVCTYSEHSAPVLKVKFNPEDCMFASCSMDKTAKYFRCEHNHYDFISSTELVSMPITAMDFDIEGDRLCTASNDALKIWNMNKNGVLVQTIDSAWKGVQDVLWGEKGIKGLASYGGYFSVWFCYLDNKSRVSQNDNKQLNQSRLPRLFKNPSIKKQKSEQRVQKPQKQKVQKIPKIKSKELSSPSNAEEHRKKQLEQAMNNINFAVGVVNAIDENRAQKMNRELSGERQRRKQEDEKQKQKIKIAEEERNQKIKKIKQKQKAERQRKQQQRRQKIKLKKQQEERYNQERLEELQRQRGERQKALEQKLHETFEDNNNKNFETTLENDILQNSSVMNLSTFMGDGAQKQKLVQIQMIGQFLKESGKYESVHTLRNKNIKPIIHLWKQGKIENAMHTMSRADMPIIYDCVSAILHNPRFKSAINPDVACFLIQQLVKIMSNKHSTYVKNSMLYLNELVLMFKDQLIKVKMFNPMTRVDLSRQERIAKYDKLTAEFLSVFKQERLKKYSCASKSADNQELYNIASELYKNLEQMLRKILPKNEPEPA